MQSRRSTGPYEGPLDMSKLAAAIPHAGDPAQYQQPRYSLDGSGVSSAMFYPMYDTSWRSPAPNPQHNPANDMRWKQADRSAGFNGGLGLYGLGWGSFPPQGQRFGPQTAFVADSSVVDDAQLDPRELRRTSLPSIPRGPPRKPKRSGNALWVGNLPPFARIEELKDHFSAGATQDIESVFLISKSNCAFVNYRSEVACIHAMNRFHNSRFRGRSLVCRLRKTTSSSFTTAAPVPTSELPASTSEIPQSVETAVEDEATSPLIVGNKENVQDGISASSGPVEDGNKSTIPAKYFILKSLTLKDLEASVSTCVWATQPHNEGVLNKAYSEAQDVFLIFSANKSGEYFGYARMSSPVSAESSKSSMDSAASPVEDADSASPRTIPTPATATAPKGRIIDDSARGSIFWEADHSDGSANSLVTDGNDGETGGNKQFEIEWISTTKLPFYQTRGMRNSWNGNREIKIARDGQELDPRVGRRLLQLFRAFPQSGPPQFN